MNDKLNDETLEREKQIYQQAMETYRHFHAFTGTVFLILVTLATTGVIYTWTEKYHRQIFECIKEHLLVLIIILLSIIILIFYISYRILEYTVKSRMRALLAAKNIEESWFPKEVEMEKGDESKLLAHRLWEAEKTSLAWYLVRNEFDNKKS